ncbi:hypothetical protein C8R44DRAFT_726583 [Mycena epipterygia]|nr:hypothetical protein C8R44DRAFT_726583 [Mycena epipterygia]
MRAFVLDAAQTGRAASMLWAKSQPEAWNGTCAMQQTLMAGIPNEDFMRGWPENSSSSPMDQYWRTQVQLQVEHLSTCTFGYFRSPPQGELLRFAYDLTKRPTPHSLLSYKSKLPKTMPGRLVIDKDSYPDIEMVARNVSDILPDPADHSRLSPVLLLQTAQDLRAQASNGSDDMDTEFPTFNLRESSRWTS